MPDKPGGSVQQPLVQDVDQLLACQVAAQVLAEEVRSDTTLDTTKVPDEGIESENVYGEKVFREGMAAERFYKMKARRTFVKRIYDLIVVTNIARIGSMNVPKGWVEEDQVAYPTDNMYGASAFRTVLDYSEQIGWPQLNTLPVSKVWGWAMQQEGFLRGFGGGPTGRALNAFTHLFGHGGDVAAHLFWSLVGIEAVYTKGQGFLQEQVKEKSQILLGKQEAHKKKIGRMYDFRSRFVHGDLDFSGRHRLDESYEERRTRLNELYETIWFSEAILIATLQTLADRGWRGVQFTTTYTAEALSE